MRKIITLFAALFLTAGVLAQAPEKMSFQAVIRNSSQQLVTNTQVGMKISIQKYILGIPPTFQNVYIETHTPTTNENGLVNLKIGDGSVAGGVFTDIDWSDGEYYIKTETDPTGGSSYTIPGTTQLLSVPYALYAKNAKTYKVGDFAQGGIVFWVDATGQHGLVCAKQDQSSGVKWRGGGTVYNTMARGDGPYAGKMNTSIIISVHAAKNDFDSHAASICNELQINEEEISYGDWYLPSRHELNLMFQNRTAINNTATAHGGSGFASAWYWSSTEHDSANARIQSLGNGNTSSSDKGNASFYVRAIRAF